MHARQPSRGFTIIEVMIVLAIAGVMLLLVFEAIPALTRNSRNNQRKQDISAILGAVSHYQLNNSGAFPCSTNVNACFAPGNPLAGTKITYYVTTAGPIVVQTLSNTNTDPTAYGGLNPVTDVSKVYVYNYQKCVDDGSGTSSAQGAGFTDIVALYAVETGGGSAPQCQQQ